MFTFTLPEPLIVLAAARFRGMVGHVRRWFGTSVRGESGESDLVLAHVLRGTTTYGEEIQAEASLNVTTRSMYCVGGGTVVGWDGSAFFLDSL